jgi:hypothetical protein
VLSGKRLRSALSLLVHPRKLWREHRRVALALVGLVVVAIAAVIVGYEVLKRPGDVHNETAIQHFKPEPPKEPPKPAPGRAGPRTVNWPMYGLNPQRTRYLPARGIKPPFRKLWRYTERPLLEFPPIYVGGVLYAVNNSGFAFSTPKPGKRSGNGGSAASTPPRRPITNTASTSSTWSPATSSS